MEMNFKSWILNEMPIRNLEMIPPEWKKGEKRKYGWNDQDVGILTSGINKFKKLWENTEHDFDFFLVRNKQANKFREIGLVDLEWVRNNLGDELASKIKDDDVITVIFTNNTGADKVPFTAWTAAHRLGHSFMRTKGMPGGLQHFREFIEELQSDQRELLDLAYRIKSPKSRFPDSKTEKELRTLSQDMGTMRSAREKTLRNYFEFAYELLAQYLMTKNKIQFKMPANQLITRYVFGNPQGPYMSQGVSEEIQNVIENNAEKYNYMIYDVLSSAINKIFVM